METEEKQEEVQRVPKTIIRGLTENFYDMQAMRIEVESQLRAFLQGGSQAEGEWLKENVFTNLEDIENKINRYIGHQLKNEPIYTEWLKDVLGIGPILAGGLISWIGNVERFATISKLWSYSGLAVDPDGRAVRRKAGEKSHFNSRLKTHCWKIGEAFVKTKGGYRKLYDEFRKEYEEKWTSPEICKSPGCKNKGRCLDGHKYAAAKRKVVKVFLAHYWMKSRRLKGLPEEHPFIIGRDGHEHLIDVISDKKDS